MTKYPEDAEAFADAVLAKAGFDGSGNPLGPNGEPAASEDIMSCRKQAMMPEGVKDASNWLTVAANSAGEVKAHSNIEAEIDASRTYSVAFARHCVGFAKPCDEKELLARIDAGLLLLADARSHYHADFLAFTIKSDCDALGMKSVSDLAVALGCSTSSVYTRIGGGSFEFALAVIADERKLTIREARKLKWRKLDIDKAIRGSRFDVEGVLEAVKAAPLSLQVDVAYAIVREALQAELSEAKGKDKSVLMIPRSRWMKMAEIGAFDVRTFELLSRKTPQERDDWLAEREVEQLKALLGDARQREEQRRILGPRDCQRRLRELVGDGSRFAPTKPHVPRPLKDLPQRKPAKRKAA